MIKTIHDYIPQLCEIFPNICKEDIKRMAEYGWRMFYYYNLRGNDTLIESSKYKYLSGEIVVQRNGKSINNNSCL